MPKAMNRNLTLLVLASAAGMLPAQTWTELGDAGQTLDFAQTVDTAGSVTTITGQCNADADLYLIDVPYPASFSVSAVASFDSQLWLFDAKGFPIVSNDDTAVGVVNPVLGAGCLKVPGRYYLAIAPYNYDPRSLAGLQWAGSVLTAAQPTGAGRREPLSTWSGPSFLAGTYTITLNGAQAAPRHAVLPSTHHFGESQTQSAGSGSNAWFDNDGGRFQILYEASNFTAVGFSGQIDLKRIMFRGEDGQHHPGGMYFPSMSVRVARTSLTAATLSSTFATNFAAPATTPLYTTMPDPVVVNPSLGTFPNNYNMVLDLREAGGPPTLIHDLNGPQPNLLVEIVYFNPTQYPDPSVGLMRMQDTAGGSALVRGRGLVSLDDSSATGTLTDSPLVMGIDFLANSGQRMPQPARTEWYGAACGGSPSAFYEAFLNGQAFDLTGLVLTPNDAAAPTTYSVSRLDLAPDVSKVGPQPDSVADDATVAHALGFTLPMPNGNATAIRACTNGFVWLDGFNADNDMTPSIGDLLANASPSGRLAPFWTDLHCGRNATTHANSGLHVVTDTTGGPGNAVCYVTWLNVGNYQTTTAGALLHTFQVVLRQATGQIEYRYGTMPRTCSISSISTGFAAITGFAPNRGVEPYLSDPQPRDLSLEVPFSTHVEGVLGNMGLDSVSTPVADSPTYGGRMFPGQTVKWNVNSVPPGSLLGVQLLDIEASRPGATLPTIIAPGCVLGTSPFAVLHEVHVLPGASVIGAAGVTVPANDNLIGAKVYAQYVVLGGLFGAPDLITVASNGLVHTIGRR